MYDPLVTERQPTKLVHLNACIPLTFRRTTNIKQAIHLHVICVCVPMRGMCAQKNVLMINVLGVIHLYVVICMRSPCAQKTILMINVLDFFHLHVYVIRVNVEIAQGGIFHGNGHVNGHKSLQMYGPAQP